METLLAKELRNQLYTQKGLIQIKLVDQMIESSKQVVDCISLDNQKKFENHQVALQVSY